MIYLLSPKSLTSSTSWTMTTMETEISTQATTLHYMEDTKKTIRHAFNLNDTLSFYIAEGMPREKMNIGLATFVHGFVLPEGSDQNGCFRKSSWTIHQARSKSSTMKPYPGFWSNTRTLEDCGGWLCSSTTVTTLLIGLANAFYQSRGSWRSHGLEH